MRLSFFIAMFLLTFVGCNHDLICADKPTKETAQHAVRTINEATEGIDRTAEDQATTLDEERYNYIAFKTLPNLARGNSLKANTLSRQTSVKSAVTSLGKNPKVVDTLQKNPKLADAFESLGNSLNHANTPEGKAAMKSELAAVMKNPEAADLARTVMRDRTYVATKHSTRRESFNYRDNDEMSRSHFTAMIVGLWMFLSGLVFAGIGGIIAMTNSK